MRAKVRTRTRTNKETFGDLQAYISHEAKAIAVRTSKQIAFPDTTAVEMTLLAGKTIIKRPLYHYVLSWPHADKVSEQQIFGSVEGSLAALGYVPSDYQWVSAIHGDTDHQHAHTLVNRVHPETLRALNPRFDYPILDRFCREEERRNGWTAEAGIYKFTEDGKLVIDRDRGKNASPFSGAAMDSEVWTGMASFQRWVQQEVSPELSRRLSEDPRWETLHNTLAEYNLRYETLSRGAVVFDASHPRHRAKATHLAMEFSPHRLEARLGPYQPALEKSVLVVASYNKRIAQGALRMGWMSDDRVRQLYAVYQNELDAWKSSGLPLRAEALAQGNTDAKNRLLELREQRAEVFRGVSELVNPPVPKHYLEAAFKEAFSQEHSELVRHNREERATIRSAHRPPESLFRKWLKRQADAGDLPAKQALKALRSGELTGARTLALHPIDTVEATAPLTQMRETAMQDHGWLEPSDGIVHEPSAALREQYNEDITGDLEPLDELDLAQTELDGRRTKELDSKIRDNKGISTDWTTAEPTWAEVAGVYAEARKSGSPKTYMQVAQELRDTNQASLDAHANNGTALNARDLNSPLYIDTKELNAAQVARHREENGDPKKQPSHQVAANQLIAQGKTLAAYEQDRRENPVAHDYHQQYKAYLGTVPTIQQLWEAQLAHEADRKATLGKNFAANLKEDRSLPRGYAENAKTQAILENLAARDRLSQSIEAERETLKELTIRHRTPTFEEFLAAARERDPQAQKMLDQLVDERTAPPTFDLSSIEESDRVLRALRKLNYSRDEETGVITYRLENGRAFQDHGTRLDCEHADPEAIRAQLMLVKDRFANGITVGGTEKYKAIVVQEAARLRILVSNPELQQSYAKELAAVSKERGEDRKQWQALHEAMLNTPVRIYDTPQEHAAAFETALQGSALAVARHRGNLVDEITKDGPREIHGVAQEAWTVHDRTFVVVDGDGRDSLVQTEIQPEAYDKIDRAVVETLSENGRYVVDVSAAEPTRVWDNNEDNELELDHENEPEHTKEREQQHESADRPTEELHVPASDKRRENERVRSR